MALQFPLVLLSRLNARCGSSRMRPIHRPLLPALQTAVFHVELWRRARGPHAGPVNNELGVGRDSHLRYPKLDPIACPHPGYSVLALSSRRNVVAGPVSAKSGANRLVSLNPMQDSDAEVCSGGTEGSDARLQGAHTKHPVYAVFVG